MFSGPILSITGSILHKLVKWLAELLDMFMENCIKDLFTFASYMQNYPFNSDDKFVFI